MSLFDLQDNGTYLVGCEQMSDKLFSRLFMFALVDERDEERREIATRTISGSSFKQIQGALSADLAFVFQRVVAFEGETWKQSVSKVLNELSSTQKRLTCEYFFVLLCCFVETNQNVNCQHSISFHFPVPFCPFLFAFFSFLCLFLFFLFS